MQPNFKNYYKATVLKCVALVKYIYIYVCIIYAHIHTHTQIDPWARIYNAEIDSHRYSWLIFEIRAL